MEVEGAEAVAEAEEEADAAAEGSGINLLFFVCGCAEVGEVEVGAEAEAEALSLGAAPPKGVCGSSRSALRLRRGEVRRCNRLCSASSASAFWVWVAVDRAGAGLLGGRCRGGSSASLPAAGLMEAEAAEEEEDGGWGRRVEAEAALTRIARN